MEKCVVLFPSDSLKVSVLLDAYCRPEYQLPLWNTDDLTPFYLSPSKKFYDLTPPWNVPSSKKVKIHLKKQKILFPAWNKNTFERWNANIQLYNLNIKGELDFF